LLALGLAESVEEILVHLFQIAKEGGFGNPHPLSLDVFDEGFFNLGSLGGKVVVPMGNLLECLGDIRKGRFRANRMSIRAGLAGMVAADEGVCAFGTGAEMSHSISLSALSIRLLLVQLQQLGLQLRVNLDTVKHDESTIIYILKYYK
jgi:hypothetical protein